MGDPKPQPCPWTNQDHSDEAVVLVDCGDGNYAVECLDCWARSPTMCSSAEAVTAWDRIRLEPGEPRR